MNSSLHINDLPDEILEYILSTVPPYKDLKECMLVCKRWHCNVQRVIYRKKLEFYKAISNFSVEWQSEIEYKDSTAQWISKRYSHSACIYGDSMYVFGGCTCTSTTFNDLWRLELSTRKWDRLLSTGSYPSPKACASLVHHKNSLYLFGGWTHPTPLPFYQAWKTYNELHVYNIRKNRWKNIPSVNEDTPRGVAGHSATVHGTNMIVFGGLIGVTGATNAVWCFDMVGKVWEEKETSELKPSPRYAHSQICIDDDHLIILGGWGLPPSALSDVWLLDMSKPVWQWREIIQHNSRFAPFQMHPACRVADYAVVVSEVGGPTAVKPRTTWTYYTWGPTNQREQEAEEVRPVDRDVNVNGRRGSLRGGAVCPAPQVPVRPVLRHEEPVFSNASTPAAPSLSLLAFTDTGQLAGRRVKRDRQLELLRNMEERVRGRHARAGPSEPPPPVVRPPRMSISVLDLSALVRGASCLEACPGPCARWLPSSPLPLGGPTCPTVHHTLVPGHAEIIMFGGFERQASSPSQPRNEPSLSNSIHFISAPLPLL